MEELAKIYRVIDRELPYSDRESLLVLDATTGQNAVNQAKEFKNVAEITGIILTKLDGTAKGGVVLNIKNELGVPVKFIGVGERWTTSARSTPAHSPRVCLTQSRLKTRKRKKRTNNGFSHSYT